MDRLAIQHLHKLKERHLNRLRPLELQAAEYGIDCPAHISAEVDRIKEELANVEHQLTINSVPSQYTLSSIIQTKSSLKITGIVLTILMIAMMLGLTHGTPHRVSANEPQNPDPLSGIISKSNSPHMASRFHSIVCRRILVTTFIVLGPIQWQQMEINEVLIEAMPTKNKILTVYVNEMGFCKISLDKR